MNAIPAFLMLNKIRVPKFLREPRGACFRNPANFGRVRSEQQVARQRGKIIAEWWKARGALPQPFETTISVTGTIHLTAIEGKSRYLRGGLGGKRRPCWLKFEEVDDNKLVHVYEVDKETKLNSFYIVKDGQILENPEPVNKSPSQLALERGRAIAEWWKGSGIFPQPFESSIRGVGTIILFAAEGKQRILSGGLGSDERPYWLRFEEEDNNKIVYVYEADRKTLLNSFYLVKDGKILENPEPVEISQQQLALERGRAIAEWWKGSGSLPQPFETTVSNEARISLVSVEKKPRCLVGGLGRKRRPCWLSFEEKNNNKLVHVFEEDKEASVNSFYLLKDGQILEDPEPVEKTSQKLALERGQLIVDWWRREGKLPQFFEHSISKGGKIFLVRFGGKQRVLSGALRCEKRFCWLIFISEEDHNNKIVAVYEKDRKTLINAFYLVRRGEILDKPVLVEKSKKESLIRARTEREVARPHVPAKPKTRPRRKATGMTPTDRQRLNYGIGRGDYDAIAAEYSRLLLGMAPYWSVLARNSLLLQLQQQGLMPSFQDELSLGAGPSTSHIVWSNLSQDVRTVDLDRSRNMLLEGPNQLKILGDMSGPLPFADGSFGLVTIDSAFRYVKPELRFFTLSEAQRVLQPGGILSITELGYLFDQTFLKDLKGHLSFNPLTPANYTMELDADFRRKLKGYDQKVYQTIRGFLRICGTLITVKGQEQPQKPEQKPQFELRHAKPENGQREDYNGRAIAGTPSDFDLSNFDELTRLLIGIKPIQISETEARVREVVRGQLRKAYSGEDVNGGLVEEVSQLILENSDTGSLLELVRHPEKLRQFNTKMRGFGLELKVVKRRKGTVAWLKKII